MWRSRCVFAITARKNGEMEPWLDARYERTTIDKYFFSGHKFADEYVKDFSLLVSDPLTGAAPGSMDPRSEDSSSANWAANDEAGTVPENVNLANYAPWLSRVASGEELPLTQGDAAVAAAGLKEMKMGFGPGGGMEEVNAPKKKKKKAKKAKEEL